MKRTVRAVFLLAVALLLLTAGCYTVIRHPTGSHVVQEGTYYKSCADCHADASFYHPYGHPYYRYGRSHYSWGGYYGSPWWYSDYWWWDDHYYDDDDYEYDGPEVETGTRHLWGDSGWPSSGWGFNPPSGGNLTLPDRPSPPPRMMDAQEKPEKEKQKPPKPKDFRPAQRKTKKSKDTEPDKPNEPDKQDGESREKLRPRKNPNSGS